MRERLASTLVALAALLAFTAPAAAHNGLGLKPVFSSPQGLVVVSPDDNVSIRWTSEEVHADTDYRLYYQAPDVPPTPAVAARERVGTGFASFPADAQSYDVVWEGLSALSSGAWRVYIEFDEPPFCNEIELAPAVVVLHRSGDPPPLAAIVTAPSVESVVADDEATVSVEAYGGGPLSVTIEVGELIRDPDFPPGTLCAEFVWTKTGDVMADIPLVADPSAGANRYRLDATWDTRDVPVGAYLPKITVRDSAGKTEVAYARRWINVARGGTGPRDIGPVIADGDAGGDRVEAAEAAGEVDPAHGGSGCQGARRGVPLAWAIWLATMLIAVRLRGRVRTKSEPFSLCWWSGRRRASGVSFYIAFKFVRHAGVSGCGGHATAPCTTRR